MKTWTRSSSWTCAPCTAPAICRTGRFWTWIRTSQALSTALSRCGIIIVKISDLAAPRTSHSQPTVHWVVCIAKR